MKKITLLSFLLIGFLGFSQEFPIDFEDAADDNWGAFNGAVATVVDSGGGDNVLELVSNGVDFDGAALGLATAVDMSDDGNNTITFTMDPQDALGPTEVRTHLFKFEGGSGGPAIAELYFDTTGPDEQTISLDFGAGLGTFTTIVIFADSGSGNTATGTYWIDDIAGGTNAGASCSDGIQNGDETGIDCGGSCPNACPPDAQNPTTPDGEVIISLFNDIPGFTNAYPVEGEFGSRNLEDLGAENDEAIRMDFSLDGWGQFNNSKPDLSAAGYLNFSYYAPNIPAGPQGHLFYIMLNSGTGEKYYELKTDGSGDGLLVFDSWQNVSVPMSFWISEGFEPDQANSGGLLAWKLGSVSVEYTTVVYFDNIYFSVNPGTLGTNEFEVSNFSTYPNPTNNVWNIEGTQTIESVFVFDVLGKQVMSVQPNSSNVELNASSLPNGLYFAKVSTALGTKSIKLIKE